MSDDNKKSNTAVADENEAHRSVRHNSQNAYMNRMFCSTKERVAYILKTSFGTASLGKYDTSSDLFLYKVFGLSPTAFSKANAGLAIYDMINDPISAAIVDNMRSRWGKFKPFQWLALIPNLLIGLATALIPLMALNPSVTQTEKLWAWMAVLYATETVNAFFNGGGNIDKVFTPNPNERTSLLVSSKFTRDLFNRLPQQIVGILYDLTQNGKLNINIIKLYVIFNSFLWLVKNVPNIYWTIVSKERVVQSEKPPSPIKGIMAVFKNRPLLMYTLSSFIDGINIQSSSSLYYSEVLNFTMLPTVGGIPGAPISYASYAFVGKFRKRFSTKALWIMQRGAILSSQTLFFLVGLIGGKKNGLYLKKLPMVIAFAVGNSLEMVFYATKGIIIDEINYEVLDYCEWKNGYRVEATIGMVTGYFIKIKDIFLKLINGWLLEKWAGYMPGMDSVQTLDTKFRMFVTAFGPSLIFDALSLIPMFFYNIDKETRDRMYLDLEKRRAETAQRVKELADDSVEETFVEE